MSKEHQEANHTFKVEKALQQMRAGETFFITKDKKDEEAVMEAQALYRAEVADPVNHPSHYTSHPSGVECITITEHMSFNLGNALKYIWRADLKNTTPLEDLKKAQFYINREIAKHDNDD